MTKLKHTFKYLKAGKYKRPLIPIILKYKNKQIPVLSLVDSGADFNVFHADIATLLGIDITKLSKMNFGGIKKDEKQCTGYLATINLVIGNDCFDSAALFSSDISDSGYGVLGQSGFFDHFRVTLDYKTDNIYLKRS